MAKRFAVIGNPVAHSRSPQIHELFAAQLGIELTYERRLAPLDGFASSVQAFFTEPGTGHAAGLNVTVPFKAEAAALAQVCSLRVQAAQAANTLWLQDGQLHADNTDGLGLLADLRRLGAPLAGACVLLLGAGGAAAGVCAPLLQVGVRKLVIANRTLARAAAVVNHLAIINEFKYAVVINPYHFYAIDLVALEHQSNSFDLIINATSAGLQGALVTPPQAAYNRQTFCYDMLYAKGSATAFTLWARAQGMQATDGLGMLVEQAAEAFYLWHGVRPASAPVLAALLKSDQTDH